MSGPVLDTMPLIEAGLCRCRQCQGHDLRAAASPCEEVEAPVGCTCLWEPDGNFGFTYTLAASCPMDGHGHFQHWCKLIRSERKRVVDLRAAASPRAEEERPLTDGHLRPDALRASGEEGALADAEWRRSQALIGVKDALNELRIANAQLRRARGISA